LHMLLSYKNIKIPLKKYRNAEYKAAGIWHSRYDFVTTSQPV
jgi:hypothetical protein